MSICHTQQKETEFFASSHLKTDGQMTARILCARSRASTCARSRDALAHVRQVILPSVLGRPSVFGPPVRACCHPSSDDHPSSDHP